MSNLLTNLLSRLQKSRGVLPVCVGRVPPGNPAGRSLPLRRWRFTTFIILAIFIFPKIQSPVFAQECKPLKPCDPTKYKTNQIIQRENETCGKDECEVSCEGTGREGKYATGIIRRKCAPKGSTTTPPEWCPALFRLENGLCCRGSDRLTSKECVSRLDKPSCQFNFEWDGKFPGECIQTHWEGTTPLRSLCDVASNLPSAQKKDCETCVKAKDEGGKGGIWSAIGCLPTEISTLLKEYVFTYGVGIAGGVAFLYFLYGAFMILTSSGNAEKIEEAKQIITSALAGLLLIIFSIFLLKTIGVDILKLPGFGP